MLKEIMVMVAFLILLAGLSVSFVIAQRNTEKQKLNVIQIMEYANETN